MERVECEVDDAFFTTIKFRNGAIGHLFFSWAGHGESVSIPTTIYGTRECIKGDEVKDRFFSSGIRNPMALETL
ncbi:hypothetical protein J7L27_06860 [Candidatus Bathyarchaeota archaeon]|nr:hypothetical protein [Candidatus Bathyarchaeota archaeon]